MPHIGYFLERGHPKPLSVGSPAFISMDDTQEWNIADYYLDNRTVLTEQTFLAPVFLPHGATVTKFTLQGKRTTAVGTLTLYLYRNPPSGNAELMAELAADWADGDGSIETSNIEYAKIDNEAYYYFLLTKLDPDAVVEDVKFRRAIIDWN